MKAILRDEREMKDSGIVWASKMPNHWVTIPLYSVLEEINQKNEPIITTNILSLTNTDGVIPYSERGNQGNKAKNSFEDYKVVYPNTIVANSMNILIGSVGLSKYEGCVSPVYYVYKSKNDTDIRYINYLFQMESFQKNLRQYANGILEIRLRVSSHDILHQNIAFPSYKEQEIIANYLDDRCSKIDAIIAESKASIEEYKELKQAVIYEAVTKGLDKNVEMKDSGNIWYGLIPRHWELHKVCWDYSVELGKMLDQKRISGKNLRPYLRNADVKWDNINFKDLPEMDFGKDELERYKVQPGDLMICEGGEIGKCNIIPQDCPKGIYYQKALHRVRAYKSSVSKYLRYLIMFLSKSGYINDSAQKATIFHLPAEKLKALRIPTPSVKEQTGIATYLDARTSDIDNLILEKQSLIEDLESYKKSLIYEVVTGKRKVVE